MFMVKAPVSTEHKPDRWMWGAFKQPFNSLKCEGHQTVGRRFCFVNVAVEINYLCLLCPIGEQEMARGNRYCCHVQSLVCVSDVLLTNVSISLLCLIHSTYQCLTRSSCVSVHSTFQCLTLSLLCVCFSCSTCQCLTQSLICTQSPVCVSVVRPANVSLSLLFVFQSFYLPMSHSVSRLCFSHSTYRYLNQSLVCVSVILYADVSLSLLFTLSLSFVFHSFYLPMS